MDTRLLCHSLGIKMGWLAAYQVPGLRLRWFASKASSLVITAHKIRAFLLASVTTAFCQPERSRKAAAQVEIRSCRRCAVMTADFAPWISRLRR